MCVGDVEHLLYLLFDYRFADLCWRKVALQYDMWNVENASVWLLSILCSKTHENIMKIVPVLWAIWFARNKIVWENKTLTLDGAVAWSLKQINEWREVNKKKQEARARSRVSCMMTEQKWKPPDTGELKLNVDASVFKGYHMFRIGMVLRDDQRHFIQGKCMRFVGSISVLEAETVGILEALMWVQNMPTRRLTIESDSILSVNAINKAACNYLELGDLLKQCRSILDGITDFQLCLSGSTQTRCLINWLGYLVRLIAPMLFRLLLLKFWRLLCRIV